MKLTNAATVMLSLLPLAVLVLSKGAFADEGELWQTEVKVEMSGVSSKIPPQSNSVCVPRGHSEDLSHPKDASCKTTDLKKAGNKTSFKLACNIQGKMKMTGDGEMEQQGSDSYRGKIHMVMDDGRKKMEMNEFIASTRLGTCDYQSHK